MTAWIHTKFWRAWWWSGSLAYAGLFASGVTSRLDSPMMCTRGLKSKVLKMLFGKGVLLRECSNAIPGTLMPFFLVCGLAAWYIWQGNLGSKVGNVTTRSDSFVVSFGDKFAYIQLRPTPPGAKAFSNPSNRGIGTIQCSKNDRYIKA